MRYIDLHCDTLTELRGAETLENNSGHLKLKDIKGNVLVLCCSMFIPTGIIGGSAEGELMSESERRQKIEAECERIYANYDRELRENANCLRKVMSKSDIKKCEEDNKTGILLTIEDGGVLFGSSERLIKMYKQGVRLITLTWNHKNEIGYPNSADSDIMARGLTNKGHILVEQMADMGIIVDVSHLSDGGFFDVADIMYKKGKMFVASHSNARKIAPHPRNMSDEMIKKISECGGVIGLNLAPHFLRSCEPPDGLSRIDDIVKHAHHIKNVGGADVLAIGSDFDGIEGTLEIKCPQDFEKLWQALNKAGFTENELEKMWQLNAKRVLL